MGNGAILPGSCKSYLQMGFQKKPRCLYFSDFSISLTAAQSGILDRTISLIMKNKSPMKKVCKSQSLNYHLPFCVKTMFSYNVGIFLISFSNIAIAVVAFSTTFCYIILIFHGTKKKKKKKFATAQSKE